jgi:hypothetical protein
VFRDFHFFDLDETTARQFLVSSKVKLVEIDTDEYSYFATGPIAKGE